MELARGIFSGKPRPTTQLDLLFGGYLIGTLAILTGSLALAGGTVTLGGAPVAVYRTVDAIELADVALAGVYRTGAGQVGKYLYPSLEQAVSLAARYQSMGWGAQTVTTATTTWRTLYMSESFTAATEGLAYFVRSESLHLIGRVTLLGI